MNLKRAIWISIVTYVLSFLIGLIPAFFMDVDVSQVSDLPLSFFIIGVVVSVVLTGFFTLVYFKKVKPSAKEGFYFGLVLITMGFIMDFVIFLLSSLSVEAPMDIFDYYSSPFFWIALILVVAAATIIGAIKAKRK